MAALIAPQSLNLAVSLCQEVFDFFARNVHVYCDSAHMSVLDSVDLKVCMPDDLFVHSPVCDRDISKVQVNLHKMCSEK